MINLGRCITYLLGKHESVGLSGIGTFRCLQHPAQWDSNKGLLVAPVRRVLFEPDKSAGSEHIVAFIKAQKWISYEQASHLLNQALDELTQTLAHGPVMLDGLGELYMRDGVILFKAMHLSGNEPLASQRTEPIPNPEPELTADPSAISIPVATSPVEMAETVEEEEILEERRSRFSAWVIALFVLIVLGGAAFAVHYFRPDLSAQGMAYVSGFVSPNDQLTDINPTETPSDITEPDFLTNDSLNNETSILDTLGAAVEPTETDSTSLLPEEEAVPEARYGIVVGSFTTMAQAEQFAEEMLRNGHKLEVLDSRMPGNRKKVIYAYYATRAEAYRALRTVQREVEAGAWVTEINR